MALAALLCFGVLASSHLRAQQTTIIPVLRYRVVGVYPHDHRAFTEGLAFADDVLYEATGLQGHSEIRKVRLQTGEVLHAQPLDAQYFGEGITVFADRLVQLTYLSGTGFVYNRRTLKQTGSFKYPGDGWGLTTDGTSLIVSDGSAVLRFLDPRSFKETSRLTVRAGTEPVEHLNELEFVHGEILANVWPTFMVARISRETGKVMAWIDFSGILDDHDADVMNGIAYDSAHDRLFVTGKWWPKLFEVQVIPAESFKGSS
jgi:glutamine cyclotransferase